MSENKTERRKPEVVTSKIISLTWGGLPGCVIEFPVGLGFSAEFSEERAKYIGLPEEERKEAEADFSLKLVADILEDVPRVKWTEGGSVFSEVFPGFEDYYREGGKPEDLAEGVVAVFSKEDKRGRRIYARLIEEVVGAFWTWALPRPTSSVSE